MNFFLLSISLKHVLSAQKNCLNETVLWVPTIYVLVEKKEKKKKKKKKKIYIYIYIYIYMHLSHDVASGSDIMPYNKIDKPLVAKF